MDRMLMFLRRFVNMCSLIVFSPITGAKGNIEFLLYVGKKENLRYNSSNIDDVVRNSHDMLSQ